MARTPKYKDEKTLKKAINAYFGKRRIYAPNKAGLCLHLGVSRDTYSEYRERYPDAIKSADLRIEDWWVDRLAGTTPTGAIFYLKNAFHQDYKDRHENDTTIRPASLTKDDIGVAIDKLPEKERDSLYVQLAAALTGGKTTGGAA